MTKKTGTIYICDICKREFLERLSTCVVCKKDYCKYCSMDIGVKIIKIEKDPKYHFASFIISSEDRGLYIHICKNCTEEIEKNFDTYIYNFIERYK